MLSLEWVLATTEGTYLGAALTGLAVAEYLGSWGWGYRGPPSSSSWWQRCRPRKKDGRLHKPARAAATDARASASSLHPRHALRLDSLPSHFCVARLHGRRSIRRLERCLWRSRLGVLCTGHSAGSHTIRNKRAGIALHGPLPECRTNRDPDLDYHQRSDIDRARDRLATRGTKLRGAIFC